MEIEYIEIPSLRRRSKLVMKKATMPTPPQTPTKPHKKRKKDPDQAGESHSTNPEGSPWQDENSASCLSPDDLHASEYGGPDVACGIQEDEPAFYEGIKESHVGNKGQSKVRMLLPVPTLFEC